MNDEQLIETIYKKLEYACFLNLNGYTLSIRDYLSNRNWECVDLNPQPGELQSIFETKYPTIFHYSWIGKNHTQDFVDYIKYSTQQPGWQKRFIVFNIEEINADQESLLVDYHYSKIEGALGNCYIHNLYKHYLNRK